MGCLLERVSVFALCAAVGGCATMRAGGGSRDRQVVVAGVWEGMSQSTLQEGNGAGDTRIERQSWRLDQKGDTISGYYVVELTMISGDGRPYLCSREPRFSTLLRFDVRGRIGRDGIDLEEVGDVMARGTCRQSYHMPAHYQGSLTGDVLTVSDGEHRIALSRRTGSEAAAAAQQLLAFANADGSWTAEPGFATLAR